MIVDGRLLAFLGLITVLIVTPGPDMALVMRNALRHGAPAAWMTSLGVALGSAVWATLSLAGVAVVLEASAFVFTALKLCGAAYLVYLGVRSLRQSMREGSDSPTQPVPARRRAVSRRSAFLQGLAGNLLNPKAAVIFISLMPQFIRHGDHVSRYVTMVVGYEAVLLTWLALYGAAVARAGRSRAGARVRRTLERVTGGVLVALGLRVAMER